MAEVLTIFIPDAVLGSNVEVATLSAVAKAEDTAHTSGDRGIMALAVRKDTATPLAGADGNYAPHITDALGRLHVNVGTGRVVANSEGVTITVDVVRPADASTYSSLSGGDAWATSTSAPAALTFADAARGNALRGMVTDMVVVSSAAPATPLQAELWLFDTPPTAINDNATFSVSDAQMKTFVGKIPFGLSSIGANGHVHLPNVNLIFDCVGASAALTGLIRVVNDYVPTSGETLTFRLKIVYAN